MRYLILSNFIVLLFGCNVNTFKNLHKIDGDVHKIQKYKPNFTVALYNTRIDVIGNHLSGLLLIKKMPDSCTRIVFSNEIGFKFFDFEFKENGEFKVFYIMNKMNKQAVIKTLRKDFELLLMNNLNIKAGYILKDSSEKYFMFPQQKGTYQYITDVSNSKLLCMQRASSKKAIAIIKFWNKNDTIMDSIAIEHTTFNFTIGLKRIQQ